MKFIEELVPGDCFIVKESLFLITYDFRQTKFKKEIKAISMKDGSAQWLAEDLMVEHVPLYRIDESNNFVPIKEHKNEYSKFQ